MTPRQLSAAYALDWMTGDPEWFPHPVRLFGLLTHSGERLLRPLTVGRKSELLAGAVLTASVVSAGWALGRPQNAFWQLMLAWNSLATRSLLSEAGAVVEALEAGDIALARARVARIVGRDTEFLDETEISRAVIETLAESTCDGIVAPLFWLALCGVPGAMAYKAVNTLDSMIGHREPPYRYFGRFAARLDDVVNFVPARLTAMGIAAAAFFLNKDAASAWQIARRDGKLHASPNARHSEAAMAGALGVKLGGVNVYSGLQHKTAIFNPAGARPTVQKAREAMSIVAAVSGLAFTAALLLISARRLR